MDKAPEELKEQARRGEVLDTSPRLRCEAEAQQYLELRVCDAGLPAQVVLNTKK